MDYAKESLRLHYEWKGKVEVTARAKVQDKESLSLAYTPGVTQPCLEIKNDINKSYELTRRWNTVAVITDGTAVLGLGDIGPEAGMPVMEGKCVLFKEFGDVDAPRMLMKLLRQFLCSQAASAVSTLRISVHPVASRLSVSSRKSATFRFSTMTSTAQPLSAPLRLSTHFVL